VADLRQECGLPDWGVNAEFGHGCDNVRKEGRGAVDSGAGGAS
jgi:hypothetical protein